jgi:Sulfotransferase family
MVSDSARVLFVHVQKTGGQTIEHLLRENVPDARTLSDLPGSKHATYRAALRAHPEFADYWAFGFVRNPWARLWSWWSMIGLREATAEGGNAWVAQRIRRNSFWSGVLEHCSDFESFVMKGPDRFGRLRRPQLAYLRAMGRRVDFIGRTETLQGDVGAVFDRLGIDLPPVAQRNASGSGSYREHYSPAMRQRVADLYSLDIRTFGYQFD